MTTSTSVALTDNQRTLLLDLLSHDSEVLGSLLGYEYEKTVPDFLEQTIRSTRVALGSTPDGYDRRPAVGARVRLRHDVDRYPHFVAPAGLTGEVVYDADGTYCVRLDEEVPGAEEWSNEIVWSIRDDDDPCQDLDLVEEE